MKKDTRKHAKGLTAKSRLTALLLVLVLVLGLLGGMTVSAEDESESLPADEETTETVSDEETADEEKAADTDTADTTEDDEDITDDTSDGDESSEDDDASEDTTGEADDNSDDSDDDAEETESDSEETDAETADSETDAADDAAADAEEGVAAAAEEEEESTPSYLTIDESSKTITVSDDSSVTTEIQDAINYIAGNYNTESDSNAGGWTIIVNAGTYSRFAVCEDYKNALTGLTIKAADGATVVIGVLDGSASPKGVDDKALFTADGGYHTDCGGVWINVPGVTISGLILQSGDAGSTLWSSRIVDTSDGHGVIAEGLTISNCTFVGNGNCYGVFVDQICKVTIENCSFSNIYSAVEFYGDNTTETNFTITGNTFTDCSFAIHGYTNGGSISFTGNTVTGSSSLRCKIVLQDQYSSGNLTVTVSGNTLTNAMIGLVNVSAYSVDESSAEALKSANTLDENSYVVVATNNEGEDYSTIYFSPESSHGYWALTYIADNDDLDVSWGGNAAGTDDYVKSVIDTANESGSHTLSFSVMNEDLIKTFTWFKDAIYWVGSDEDAEEPGVEKSVDKNTVEAGDTVTFTLTVSAPEYLAIYGTTSSYDSIIRYPTYVEYDVTVHDVMDAVFTMNDDIVVSIDGTVVGTSYYEIVTSTDDGCNFEVVIDFAALLDDGLLTADDDGTYPDVVITYSATVAKGTAAGTYENTTWVTYETDGRSDDSTVTVTVEEPDDDDDDYDDDDDEITITVTKVWDDDDDEAGLRPDEIEVVLYRNGKATSKTKTLSEDNDWTVKFTGLDADYEWTVEEVKVDGYTSSITSNSKGTKFTITNTLDEEEEEDEDESLSISVTKIWDDGEDADGIRPDGVTVELYANGEATGDTVVLTEYDSWEDVFADLPQYDDDGEEIEYTIAEIAVDGYESVISGNAEDGYIITNTHEVENVPEDTDEDEPEEDAEEPEEEEDEPEEETPTRVSSPQTGSDSTIGLFPCILLAVVAAFICAALVTWMPRRKR